MNLSKSLFWDTDLSDIDWNKHYKFVIHRVLTCGTWQDWVVIKNHYGLETIKPAVLSMRHLDKLSLCFCSTIFDIPPENFRCYTMMQSTQKLWNY